MGVVHGGCKGAAKGLRPHLVYPFWCMFWQKSFYDWLEFGFAQSNPRATRHSGVEECVANGVEFGREQEARLMWSWIKRWEPWQRFYRGWWSCCGSFGICVSGAPSAPDLSVLLVMLLRVFRCGEVRRVYSSVVRNWRPVAPVVLRPFPPMGKKCWMSEKYRPRCVSLNSTLDSWQRPAYIGHGRIIPMISKWSSTKNVLKVSVLFIFEDL